MAAANSRKMFNDPIHGFVEMEPLLVKIIDTPQFQRLRNLKQLGATSYVYPGATHSRFEHSIGVAYLAGEFVQALMENQPELQITPAEKICVQIAGLCHDLGHGPFSHLYDQKVIPEIERVINAKSQNTSSCQESSQVIPEMKRVINAESQNTSSWKHETASIDMFNHLVTVNKLEDDIKTAGNEDEEDHDPGKDIKKPKLEPPKDLDKELNQLDNLDFIRKLINPKYVNKTYQLAKGHTPDRSFLYEIVANKRNGIDVDKWDYFARDCHYLGIRNSFDYRRLILCARVCKVEEEGEKKTEEKKGEEEKKKEEEEEKKKKKKKKEEKKGEEEKKEQEKKKTEICFRDKEVFNLYDMFYTRFCLHKRAYQHKVSTAIGCMITDAFVRAYEHITINGFDLYKAREHMEAYTKLTDDVFLQILYPRNANNPEDPNAANDLEQARQILDRIHHRNFYKCLGEFVDAREDEVRRQWLARIPNEWNPEDFVFDVIKLNYGMGNEDPIQHVRFYRKETPDTAIQLTRDEVTPLLPKTFEEQTIRIYYKGTNDDTLRVAMERFKQWRDERDEVRRLRR